MVALPGWYLHFNGSPGCFHIVRVVSVLVHKLLAVINRMVRVLQAHILYAVVRTPTVQNDGRTRLDKPKCTGLSETPELAKLDTPKKTSYLSINGSKVAAVRFSTTTQKYLLFPQSPPPTSTPPKTQAPSTRWPLPFLVFLRFPNLDSSICTVVPSPPTVTPSSFSRTT
jgi:hypothetical protein